MDSTVTHMRITIDIADALLDAAMDAAAKDGTTLRALVEQGLRQVLDARRNAAPFRLRDAAVNGEGLRPAAQELGWDALRDLSYGDRSR